MLAKLVVAVAIGSCALGVNSVAPAARKAADLKQQTSAKHSGKGKAAAKKKAQKHAAGTRAAPAAAAPAAVAAPAVADPSPNATLSAEQQAELKAARACGDRANTSFTQVEGAVAVVNSTAITFLDSVTAAIDTAQQSLLAMQSSASSVLAIAGVDDGFLDDFVSQVSAKISIALTALNETNEDLKASLSDALGEYSAERDAINVSLAAALAAAREGLLASADEAAANASETFLMARHTAIMMGPKSTATSALAKVNATADKLIEMLGQLNSTLLATLMDDVVGKINSSAIKMQDAVISGEEKFPDGVPSSITDKIDALFDAVFAIIDAINPAEVNSQLAPSVQAATADVAGLGGCLAPLSTMVEDMDGAWPRACSWTMMSALLALSLSRAAMQ